MITENYVSFETAKILKEKSFDAKCDYFYVNGKLVRSQGFACNWNDGETLFADYNNECSAPTLQMVMKWLREIHNIHIVVYPYTDKKGHHFNFLFDTYAYGCWHELGIYITDSWNTYEQACEVAIKYCLENLI